MRALLNVDIARHLGIVLLKPSSELMPLFGAGRVLVEMPPASMKRHPVDVFLTPGSRCGMILGSDLFHEEGSYHCGWWC